MGRGRWRWVAGRGITSTGRHFASVLVGALRAEAGSNAPMTEFYVIQLATSDDPPRSRVIYGYTVITKPVEAHIGPSRFASPAKHFGDQNRQAVEGSVGRFSL